MGKNRFAQPLYGKIIYIFETNLAMEQLSTIFDPSTYWIDVTGVDCEVGYLVEFREGVGLVLTPPPNKEYTFDELKAQKMELVNAWTAAKITGGFISEATGEPIIYDSDVDTQITVSRMRANCENQRFAELYPNGMECRGRREEGAEKEIFMLQPAEIIRLDEDLGIHIRECKIAGWTQQAKVKAAQTKEDLEAIILN